MLGVLQKHQASNHNIYAKDLEQTHAGPKIVTSVSVSPYEPCLADFVGHVLLDSSGSYNVFLPLYKCSQGSMGIELMGISNLWSFHLMFGCRFLHLRLILA